MADWDEPMTNGDPGGQRAAHAQVITDLQQAKKRIAELERVGNDAVKAYACSQGMIATMTTVQCDDAIDALSKALRGK